MSEGNGNGNGTAIVRREIAVGQRGIQIASVTDLFRFAEAAVQSQIVPKSFKTPQQVFIAVQMGMELGLTPMASLSAIAVINGKAALYGDGPLGIVRRSGLLESIEERIEGQGDAVAAICTTKRKGEEGKRTTRFSVADAKRAKLWGKAGPWTDYPQRMLMFRARTWNLRDNYGDVLMGAPIAEEVRDMPPEREAMASENDPLLAQMVSVDSAPPADGTEPASDATEPRLQDEVREELYAEIG